MALNEFFSGILDLFKNNLKLIFGLLIVVYALLVTSRLPKFVNRLFGNPIFRIMVIALIVYHVDARPCCDATGALLIFVSLMLILLWIYKEKNEENIDNLLQ